MKLIALKHLRRAGGGPRIEKDSEFEASETTVEDPVGKGVARPAEEEPEEEPTKDDLYEKAKHLDIKGRSDMSKAELAEAVEDSENIERWREEQKRKGRSAKK